MAQELGLGDECYPKGQQLTMDPISASERMFSWRNHLMDNVCDRLCVKCGAEIPVPEPKHIGTSDENGYQPGSVESFKRVQKEQRRCCDRCVAKIVQAAKARRNAK